MVPASVRLFGDPILGQTCTPVTDFDRELASLIDTLHSTLDAEDGAGLAAPQIGVAARVFVFHVQGIRGELINPGVTFVDDEEQDGPEGCLSLRGCPTYPASSGRQRARRDGTRA